MTGLVATAKTEIKASPQRVWAALTEPEQIAAYMGGSRVETSWAVGSEITWSGEYDGRAYRDKGTVLAYDEPHVLSVTHYSPLMGQDDVPANYHTLVYTLAADGAATTVTLTQDNCVDEAQAAQFGRNWQAMLDGIRSYVG
ncbi:MAG TPA: SRPBCC domain-containing protein [Pseudonocardiaceae bacterium]|nr:SRPBCC domain-containing protein [Pseudonocardiaceae bacterium]